MKYYSAILGERSWKKLSLLKSSYVEFFVGASINLNHPNNSKMARISFNFLTQLELNKIS